MKSKIQHYIKIKKMKLPGAPGWLSRLRVQLLISAQVLISIVSSSPTLDTMLGVELTLKKLK